MRLPGYLHQLRTETKFQSALPAQDNAQPSAETTARVFDRRLPRKQESGASAEIDRADHARATPQGGVRRTDPARSRKAITT